MPPGRNNLPGRENCSKLNQAYYSRPRIEGNPIMDRLTSAPGQTYDYIHSQFGMIGVIAAALLLFVAALSVVFYFDRRK